MARGTETRAVFTLSIDRALLDKIKNRAWVESEGGLKPLAYTQLIKRVLQREFGEGEGTSHCDRYDPRAGAEYRVIDGGEKRG